MSTNVNDRSFLDEDLERIDVVAEMDHTQLGPGSPELSGVTISEMHFTMARLRLEPLFLGHTVLRPDVALLWVPFSWKGDYRFNGSVIDSSTIGLVTGAEGYFTRGEDAEVVGVALPQSTLHQDLSVLAGVSRDELLLPDGPLSMPAPVIQRLRKVLAMRTASDGVASAPGWAQSLREGILEALLATTLTLSSRPRDERHRIVVRRAEEYFMSVFPNQPSLVALCRATGVGKNSLYNAFQSLFGESPAAYFRKRRYAAARRVLTRSPAERGVVKRVALDHGFTELGRFSAEYRQLFGEQPSRTPDS